METRIAKALAVAASAMLVATCNTANSPPGAQSAAAGGQQCFNAGTVNDFDAIDNDTVLVNVGARNIYKLDIVGVCPDIDWSQRIAIRATGGSSFICESMDAELLVPSPTGLQRCPVVGIQKLTPEQAAALKAKPNK